MRVQIQNSTLEWENNGKKYRLVTSNTFDHSARTEFGPMNIKSVVKIVLQRKGNWLDFLMNGSVWENIRVETYTYEQLETLGVDLNKISDVKEEARKVYGMPY